MNRAWIKELVPEEVMKIGEIFTKLEPQEQLNITLANIDYIMEKFVPEGKDIIAKLINDVIKKHT